MKLEIIDAYYPLTCEKFIDITIRDSCGNIFSGLLELDEAPQEKKK